MQGTLLVLSAYDFRIYLDPAGKAIVYVTFSNNQSENEDIVHAAMNESSEYR